VTKAIECEASPTVTDAHFYELIDFDWPYLENIRITMCPHLTPFVENYLTPLVEKCHSKQGTLVSDSRRLRVIRLIIGFSTIEDNQFDAAFT
jgi:hypothetical protein